MKLFIAPKLTFKGHSRSSAMTQFQQMFGMLVFHDLLTLIARRRWQSRSSRHLATERRGRPLEL